jgi:hypothetical protein
MIQPRPLRLPSRLRTGSFPERRGRNFYRLTISLCRCTDATQTARMVHNDNMTSILRSQSICLLVSLIASVNPAIGQSSASAQHAERPAPPTRDPHTPGYVTAKELPDGSNPPANADGNFILGPTHDVPSAMSAQDDIPKGTVIEFTMPSSDSKIYPGIARDANTFGTVDPSDHAEGGCLCAEAVCAGQRRAVHRGSGRA